MKGFAHNLGLGIGLNAFISKIIVPSAFKDLFEFHNPIFTKCSIMTPQIGPVELMFLHGHLFNTGQEQELIVFRIRREH